MISFVKISFISLIIMQFKMLDVRECWALLNIILKINFFTIYDYVCLFYDSFAISTTSTTTVDTFVFFDNRSDL